MLPEIWSSAALCVSQLGQQRVGVGDQADDLVAALGQHRRSPCWRWPAGCAAASSRSFERLGEPRHTLRPRSCRSGGVSEKVSASSRQRLRQLVGVQAADRRRSGRRARRAADRATWCARAGIGPASWPSPRGVTSRILAPSRLLVLIAASVRSPSRMFLSTLNLTSTRGAVEFDGCDLAHPKPETCTACTGCQPAGLGEVRRVLLALLRNGSLS